MSEFTGKKWQWFLLSCSLFLLPMAALAQDGFNPDCFDEDPVGTVDCPLDTWIIILAVVAVLFAAFHLYRKQKSLRS